MSALIFIFNCIILLVGFQEILSTVDVGNGYCYTNGSSVYKLHTTPQTWNNARKICIQEAGHLAVINSAEEENVLMDLFQRAEPIIGATYDEIAYIGTHDQFLEADWTSILDEPLSKTGYTKWSVKWGGQPDGGVNANCGALVKDGGMDDTHCNNLLPFFCEVTIPN